jgi:uncharacterized protein YjdB
MKPAACFAAVALLSCGPSVKTVTVEPPVVALEAKGATAALKAVARDDKGRPVADAQLRPAWVSSAPLVAGVDETGKVTAQRSGEAIVTAAVGQVKGTAQVTVSILATVAVTPQSLDLEGSGRSAKLEVNVADDAGQSVPTPRGVVWSSSDPSIARVANGQVTAVGAGTATVTAAVGALRGQAEIRVKVPEFAKLVVKPARVTLKKAGQRAALKATALDRKGKSVAGVPITWKSSNERVARVQDGAVTAVKRGKARITASSRGKTASVSVTVVK